MAGLAKINVVFGSAGRPGWYARVLSHYVRPRLVRALWPRHDGLDCAREPPENGDVRRRRGKSPRLNELQRPDVGKSFPYELQHQWVVLSLPCLRSSLMVVTGLWQLIRQWKVQKRILCFTAAARSSYVLNVAKSALACKCPTKPTAGCSRVPQKIQNRAFGRLNFNCMNLTQYMWLLQAASQPWRHRLMTARFFSPFPGRCLKEGVRQIRVTNMRQSGVAASLIRNTFDQSTENMQQNSPRLDAGPLIVTPVMYRFLSFALCCGRHAPLI